MTELILRLNLHDERALLALVSRRRTGLDRAMRLVTHLGGSMTTIGVALMLLASRNPVIVDAGARGGFALIASHLVVQLLKRTIARARPRLPVGLETLAYAPDRFSFPSGHAAASLSIALAVAAVLPLLAAGSVIVLAFIVGLSRCYLGVHYPGDVLAGWSLAGAASLAAGPTLDLLSLLA